MFLFRHVSLNHLLNHSMLSDSHFLRTSGVHLPLFLVSTYVLGPFSCVLPNYLQALHINSSLAAANLIPRSKAQETTNGCRHRESVGTEMNASARWCSWVLSSVVHWVSLDVYMGRASPPTLDRLNPSN